MADIIFYTNPMSRGQIARWMLEEVGQPYDTVLLDYGTTMKAPEYLAVNPMGKVPAIRHRDIVVTEGAAICAYLADAFPDAGLAPPPGSAERGPYYRWLFYGAGPVEHAVTNHSQGWNPEGRAQAMAGYGSWETVLDVLQQQVANGPYLLGDRFSAVDVYLGSQIIWGVQFGTLENRPGFDDYIGRVTAREAYRRAKEIDGKLIAEAQAAQQG